MFKKWLIFSLLIFLLIFSVDSYAFYEYTQQSGTDYFVASPDKADALEDTIEVRMILDALGSLLGHSKYNTTYPKDGDVTVGYLGRLNYGADASRPAIPVVNDMYLATDTTKVYKCFVVGNWVQVYPEGGATTFLGLADTPANYTGQAGKYIKVNAGETDLEFGTPTGGAGTYLELTDTPAAYDNGKYAKSTVDGVVWDTPAGAGDMTKAVYDIDTDDIVDKSETVDDGIGNSSTAADVADAITKKHTQNTDTQFDFYNALADDHTWSGDKDTQPVGESVVFGDLLYFNWADKEWKKTDADAEATMPGERIALESKTDGQDCLMLVKGYIRDDNWDFGAAMIYTSVTTGAMSSTAPTETGDQIQRVGTAKSADILFFNPSIDVGEI
ncbi:hypothetical protein ES705_11390 [subsurface metagenome]